MAEAITSATSSPRRFNPWDPSTTHSNGHAPDPSLSNDHTPPPLSSDDEDAKRSPSSIFLYTYALGVAFSISTLTTLYLLLSQSTALWRLPFFLASLSLFHTLEYITTALYNPTAATTSAFLLHNGRAYNIAHLLAFLECYFHHSVFPGLLIPTPSLPQPWLYVGLCFMIMGQAVRTSAMATAGSNFNHIVQSYKKRDHKLVTGGVYAYLRHPSYFGFFWWGLGTQMVLGNVGCLVGYAVVLWRFFRRRIEHEEESLVRFFGDEYVRYGRRTTVGIPFISQASGAFE